MGFGHRVYRAEDPRARVLRRTAKELDAPRYAVAEALEQAALAELRERRPDRVLETNVEFWAAIVLDFAEVPAHMFTSMFTCARTGGWSAHILEQKRTGRLIRPSAVYTGPATAPRRRGRRLERPHGPADRLRPPRGAVPDEVAATAPASSRGHFSSRDCLGSTAAGGSRRRAKQRSEGRVGVVAEAGDAGVARRLVEGDRLGLLDPGLEHHHLGPAPRPCARGGPARGGRARDPRADGATYIRLTSAVAVGAEGPTSVLRRQAPRGDGCRRRGSRRRSCPPGGSNISGSSGVSSWPP